MKTKWTQRPALPLMFRSAALSVLIALSGCSSMKIDKVASQEPVFDFKAYFLGHTKASGWFADRFGSVKRHFCGDFVGSYDGDVFVLDEILYYTDGIVEERQWRVTISDDGEFKAVSDSLVGDASGTLQGNALQMAYQMKVKVKEDKEWILTMDDWMFYQPDGSLHNVTNVLKWGVRIGTVSTQYAKITSANDDSNDVKSACGESA